MWQDSIGNYEVQVDPSDVVLQLWNYDDSYASIFEQYCENGAKLIQSSYLNYYLDCGGENFITSHPMWCQYVSWKSIYESDVTEASKGLPEQCKDKFVGATACLWSEQVNDSNVMSKLFPRVYALAERLWTDPENASWLNAVDRLRDLNDFNSQNMCIQSAPL